MRIGIDARLYRSSVAGIGRYSQNLIKNLLEIDSGNEYVLFMTAEDAKEFNQFKIQNSHSSLSRGVHPSESKTKFKIVTTNITHYSIEEQTKLPKIIEEEKVDLMHFLNFNFPLMYRGKFIVTIHDLTLLFYPGRSKKSAIYKIAYKYILKKACQNSQKIIAVSKSTKNDIVKVFGTKPEKIETIYEAADDKIFAKPSNESLQKIKMRYGLGQEPVFLYVGQWRPHKNLVGLVRAFDILRRDLPAKLAIVGKIDAAYPEVISAIDKAEYSGDIITTGFVGEEELSAWYSLAGALVFPSFYEGFGLPGLEAMQAKTPVIASDRTSLPEIYKNAAIYFDPFNFSEIAAKMKEIITDSSLRERLIKNGIEVAQKYSWAKTAQETLEIYKQIK